MATKKPRANVVLDESIYKMIKSLSEKEKNFCFCYFKGFN